MPFQINGIRKLIVGVGTVILFTVKFTLWLRFGIGDDLPYRAKLMVNGNVYSTMFDQSVPSFRSCEMLVNTVYNAIYSCHDFLLQYSNHFSL